MPATQDDLIQILTECADDLEGELLRFYGGTDKISQYPNERRRFERDMETVRRARALISRAREGSQQIDADHQVVQQPAPPEPIDPQCARLAEHFLRPDDPGYTDADRAELAQDIQNAVEDWLELRHRK